MKKKLTAVAAVVLIIASAVYFLFSLDHLGIISLKKMFTVIHPPTFYMGEHGTADKLDGKTVCVSVFVDIENRRWQDNEAVSENQKKCLDDLQMATKWIRQQSEAYGKTAEFVCDWNIYPELYHELDLSDRIYDFDLRENNGENRLWDYVNRDIPSEELLNKFGADNIIYATYYDVERDSEHIAFSKECFFDTQFSYDMIFIPIGNGENVATATTIAHEILHLFGAPDWYHGGESGGWYFGISPECVEYVCENYPNDIMLRTRDYENGVPFYGEVNAEMSELTAYYIGLTDKVPHEVYDLGIDLSVYDSDRPKTER